jgi:hypothetical protein
MTGGFEPLYATLPLARRPMRVLTPVVEIAMLAMFHPWQDLTLRGLVALQQHFIHIPLVAGLRPSTPQPISIVLPEL